MPSGIYKRGTRHGMTKTRVHRSWQKMKERCLDKNHQAYKNYGGRGIKVCKRWLGKNGFINFYDDMGDRPEGKSLDRIKNNLGYSKENCKWSTRKEQNNNKRNNRLITYQGKTQNTKQWANELGIRYKTLHTRINTLNWSVEKAFNF